MSKRIFFILAIILVVYVYFAGLGDYGFVDPDEGRYSEIPREMIEAGDYITPRLNYVKYFEKPILHYWLTAASFKMFGQNEFAGRLTPVVLGLLGCVVTSALAYIITKDKRSSFVSAMILASSTLWFGISRINITDMTLTFFFTLSLFFFRLWAEDTQKFLWLCMFYVSMALTVLTKGLIGVVLPGGIAVIYALMTKQSKKILMRIFSPTAIIIFFIVNCIWFIPVCMANSDFFHFFFIREHFLRYTTKIHQRYQPFYWFIPILIAGLVPYTGTLYDSIKAMLGKCRLISKSDGIFLGLWFFITFIFFSFSNSKLVTYILPCFPPLAILAGASLSSFEGKEFRNFITINAVILIPLALTGIIWPTFTNDTRVIAMRIPAISLAVMLLVFTVSTFFLMYSKRTLFITCILGVLTMYSASGAFIVEGKLLSHKEAAAIIKTYEPDEVVVFQNLMQGMNFYLERRTITADTIDELEFGASQIDDADKYFITENEAKNLWTGNKRIVITARSKNADYVRKTFINPIHEYITSADIVMMNF